MKANSVKPVRCAIYTRVSTEHGLDQEFNSLDAQYDAASAYISPGPGSPRQLLSYC
jgi:site-specific DNA recombinase